MKHKFKAISSTFEEIIRKYNLEESYYENYIISNWDKIVNSQLVKITKPLKLDKKVLTIQVKSESWKKELYNNKKTLHNLINSSLNQFKIADIIFKL